MAGMEQAIAKLLGITPEALFGQITAMQNAVNGLFGTSRRIERKMDALLLRAGFSREQIEALNNDNPSIAGSGSGSERDGQHGAAAG